MMVVSQPVLPPTYHQPDAFPSAPSPAMNPNVPRSVAHGTSGPPVPFPTLTPPFVSVAAHSPPRDPAQLEPAEQLVIKSPLPPTPDPSPPTNKVLFPVHMVPLAQPAGDSNSTPSSFVALQSSSPSGSHSSSQSSNGSASQSALSPNLVNSALSTSSPSTSQLTSPPHTTRSASDTQPDFQRPSSASRSRQQTMDKDRRTKASRRQTMGGPTSVRMVESHSADSRARLRSTGGVKLSRYPTLSSEYPTGSSSSSAQTRARRINAESSTPPRVVAGGRPKTDVDDLDFGGPGGLEAKLVLLGSQGVGKTSLILRLTTGSFSSIPAPASLDGSFYKRKLVHNGVPIKLQIWDTAGQERFRSMAPIYYRGAHVCLLVYDISDRKSFQDVRSWLDELHSKASKDMIIYVVGAKTDLQRQRAVPFGEASWTIRSWLKPPEPETSNPSREATPPSSTSVLAPGSRTLFRSSSGRRESVPPVSPPAGRARPHSMHGLASLMGVGDWAGPADVDTPPAASVSPDVPTVVAPTPTKTPFPGPAVHFPSSLTTPSSTESHSSTTPPPSGSVNTAREGAHPPERRRGHRVSFHAPAPPSEPTATTTVETATASTSMGTRHSTRFSISGVLGLNRSTSMSMSDAMSNLTHLVEANPPRHLQPRTSFSPSRSRTESSPMLGHDLPKQRSEDWSAGGPAWGRGEGPSAADALEEFGASVRHEAASRSNSNTSEGDRRARVRGGSLGRDARLYGSHNKCAIDDEDEDPVNAWGTEIEGVRLGEVSSLTGEGVEEMCLSISACLIERKDKLERERQLRHKNSVMLTDPANSKETGKSKGRYGCCA